MIMKNYFNQEIPSFLKQDELFYFINFDLRLPLKCPHCEEITIRSINSTNYDCGKCRKYISRTIIKTKIIDGMYRAINEKGIIKVFKIGKELHENFEGRLHYNSILFSKFVLGVKN